MQRLDTMCLLQTGGLPCPDQLLFYPNQVIPQIFSTTCPEDFPFPVPDLIIFDCDGVLIDSEPLAVRVGTRVLNHAGFPVTEQEINGYVGVSAPAMYADLEQKYKKTVPPNVQERWTTEIIATFHEELKAIDGIHAFIDRLSIPACVASNSPVAYLDIALGIVGLTDYFAEAIFSAEMVVKGKPAPDLFLHAAKEMGASPADCLVVEDSVNGVNAAVAANIPVLGFIGGGHCKPGDGEKLLAAGAERVFAAMNEISQHLSRSDR